MNFRNIQTLGPANTPSGLRRCSPFSGLRSVFLLILIVVFLSGCYTWREERSFRRECHLNGGTPEFHRTNLGLTTGMRCRYD